MRSAHRNHQTPAAWNTTCAQRRFGPHHCRWALPASLRCCLVWDLPGGTWHQSSLLSPAPSTPRLRNVGKNPPLPPAPINREHFWGVGWVETVKVLEGCGTCDWTPEAWSVLWTVNVWTLPPPPARHGRPGPTSPCPLPGPHTTSLLGGADADPLASPERTGRGTFQRLRERGT